MPKLIQEATHIFVGRMPCGCDVAATPDSENQSAVKRVDGRHPTLGHVCGRENGLSRIGRTVGAA
ncbi:MAG: hypothetical protein KGL39_57625 [Patescibacteria group bacterium]|nr:hypothetical protein [Patescibacteria group bacterium]